MARTFDKDYKYLLTHLVPRHHLRAERRRQITEAVAGNDPARMRVAAVLALSDLLDGQYFDHIGVSDEDGHVVVTYTKDNGSYQIRLVVPADEWRSLPGGSRSDETALTGKPHESAAPVESRPVETTINVLPDIIRSFSINGEGESTLESLDSVLGFMPRGFRFAGCRLVLVEERISGSEEFGEHVVTQRENVFHERPVYQECRRSRQIAVLDPRGAEAVGIPRPVGDAERVAEQCKLAVAPIFSHDDFWGILEVWSGGSDNGALFRTRVEIASGIIEQIIGNSVRLENLTSIDKLTGIYNRQFYDRLVRIEMERATRSGTKLSLLVLDLDDFKSINDTLGHRKGDEALVVVADLMRSNLRKIDLPFRYGGEEFAVLLPGTPETEAIHTAERLRTVIEGYEEFLDQNGSPRQVTVSIGAAVFPDQARTEEELFSRADAALYLAKRKGKNRVEFYHQ